MRVPVPVNEPQPAAYDFGRRPPPPRAYDEEMQARRYQEQRDEELARRLQGLGIGLGWGALREAGPARHGAEDGDVFVDIHGVGNAAPHHMNETYVREVPAMPTGPYVARTAAADYASDIRARRRRSHVTLEERVTPARVRRVSAVEVVVFAPEPPVAAHVTSPSASRRNGGSGTATPSEADSGAGSGATRSSVLAGLERLGRNGGGGKRRVDAWRNHVEDGLPSEAAV